MTRVGVRHVVLVGYRGCGKTTVGALVAGALSVPFIDTDELIAAGAGMSIAEVFASKGESGFRGLEASVIRDVTSGGAAVIAVGGGAVLSADNVKSMRANGVVIWLTASAETLAARIGADASSVRARPALTSMGGLDEVRALLAAREPLYRGSAEVTFSSEDQSPEQIARDVVRWLADRGMRVSASE